MTVFQEQRIILLINLIMLIAIFFRLCANKRAADRHERQRHADAARITQYLDAIHKQLSSIGS